MSKFLDTPLKDIICTTRALNLLEKEGYHTYSDIRSLTLDDLKKIKGMGEVSAESAWAEIVEFRNKIPIEIIRVINVLVDKVGYEKALEMVEQLAEEV